MTGAERFSAPGRPTKSKSYLMESDMSPFSGGEDERGWGRSLLFFCIMRTIKMIAYAIVGPTDLKATLKVDIAITSAIRRNFRRYRQNA